MDLRVQETLREVSLTVHAPVIDARPRENLDAGHGCETLEDTLIDWVSLVIL